jgi:peptide/nickel transport system permease protein
VGFIVRRLAQLAVVLVLVTFFTAILTTMVPGGTVDAVAPFATAERKAEISHELHLDEPLPKRYVAWLSDFVRGDLGKYYDGPQTSHPVSDTVSNALPKSLQLMLFAQALSLLFAIPLGVLTAYRAGSLFDKAVNTASFGLLAIPNFVLGLVLAYWLGVKLDWFPVLYDRTLTGFGGTLQNLFLPAVSLAAAQIAVYMRLLRSDMIATLQEDYITMAKAKGMSPSRILWRHALRPSSLTLLTAAGLNVGALIGGAVVIEVIFGIPGMGLLISQAILGRQFVALQSLVAIIAVGYILVNVFVDVMYAVLDPRIRHARAA